MKLLSKGRIYKVRMFHTYKDVHSGMEAKTAIHASNKFVEIKINEFNFDTNVVNVDVLMNSGRLNLDGLLFDVYMEKGLVHFQFATGKDNYFKVTLLNTNNQLTELVKDVLKKQEQAESQLDLDLDNDTDADVPDDISHALDLLTEDLIETLKEIDDEHDPIAYCDSWFKKAFKNVDLDKAVSTQIGVLLEEQSEMLSTLKNPLATIVGYMGNQFKTKISNAAVDLNNPKNVELRKQFLDDATDQMVVIIGLCNLLNMDIKKALYKVTKNNFTKFDKDGNPVFDSNGKILKSECYEGKVDLSDCI